MKEKTKNILNITVPVLLALLMLLNAAMLYKISQTDKRLDAVLGESEDVAQENDVTIGGEYVIKDTTNISDAYKSGNSSGLSDKDRETLDMASAVLDEIITGDMSDYEKELAVYDWMTHNLTFDSGSLLVVPDTQADCDNPYGVLKYHNAVCVGYATTFRLFMQMMDIECMVVHDSYLSHSWDLVRLDGEWYHTDIYSDAGVGNYAHFNLSDNAQMGNQDWNTDFFPAAEGYKYNYAYMNRTECEDIYALPAALREAMDNMQPTAAFSFGQEIGDAEAQIVGAMLDEISTIMSMSGYNGAVGMEWNWLPTEEGYVLCVYIMGFEEPTAEPEPDLPDDAYEKLDEAVSSAFGDISYDVDDMDGAFYG